MRLLYVEDNPIDVDLLKRILSRFLNDIQLSNADCIEAAKSFIKDKNKEIDLLIIDLHLPDGNGLQLLQWVREHNYQLAIIILTGSEDHETALTALKSGADDYLVKEDVINLSENNHSLMDTFENALEHYRTHRSFLNRPLHVLYVEHHVIDIDLTVRHLAKHAPNIHLTVVHDAEQALDILPKTDREKSSFHLVLLDYRLPTLDALEVTKEIRQKRKLSMPIILVSGQGNIELAIQAQRMGINDYLVKHENYLLQLPSVIEKVVNQSEIQHQQEKLKLANIVFDNALEAFIVTDGHGIVEKVNPAFSKMTGCEPDEIIGQNINIIKSDKHDEDFYQNFWKQIRDKGFWQGEIWNRRKNGEVYPQYLAINTSLGQNNQPTRYVGVMTDISALKESEAHLQYLANHDPLTDLPNRLLLKTQLEKAIQRTDQNNTLLAIIFIDLDRFKNINDSLGHSIGDKLLVQFSERLQNEIHIPDALCRMGGDEFILILEGLQKAQEAEDVAQKILSILDSPFLLTEDHEVFVYASIGICLYPEDGETPESLIQNADIAMYQSKSEGRNTYRFFTSELKKHVNQRLIIEAKLLRAIINKEFLLQYQPQVNSQTGKIIGCEALLRWQASEQEMMPPIEFIPLAEGTGLIVPIGDWVLNTACQQAKDWLDQGHNFGTISINLSARQFYQADIIQSVENALKRTRLPAEKLRLELTESLIMEGGPTAVDLLHKLKGLGVTISLDDFGTGYSSLAYLKNFPLDELKIDKSFIFDITDNEIDRGIVAIIIEMAKTFNLEVIAEGVETEEQLNFLIKHECNASQGYYFARPLHVEDFRLLLEKNQSLLPTAS